MFRLPARLAIPVLVDSNEITRGFKTPAQFGRELGVPEERVRSWIRDGVLPSVRLGRLVFVPEDALRWILQRQEGERP